MLKNGYINFYILAASIISLLFLGSIHFGAITLRHIAVAILLIFAIFSGNKFACLNRVEFLYFLYLVVYISINFISGSIRGESVIKNIIGYHLIDVVLILAFHSIINVAHIKRLINLICILYFINCLFTIGQYFHVPGAWEIASIVNSTSTNIFDIEEKNIEILSDYYGRAVACGLLGLAVGNGYFTAVLLPVVTHKLWSEGKKIIPVTMLMVGLISIYCIQQRMAFLIAVIYLFVISFKLFKRHKIRFMIAFFVLLGFMLTSDYVMVDLGRLTSSDGGIRNDTYYYLSSFLEKPDFILFGNNTTEDMYSDNMFLTMGHNSILDAFRRGGILNLIVFLALFVTIVFDYLYRNVKANKSDSVINVLSLSCFFYLVYSMTHSSGIQSDGVLFWLMFEILNLYILHANKDYDAYIEAHVL